MPHILVAGKLHPSGLALLDQAPGLTWDYVEEISEESYAPLIAKADGLVIRTQPLTAATIAQGGRLKIVSRHGVGYDAVDVAALTARGIALAVVGDVNSVSVAEHAMMLMLAAAKRVTEADGATRDEGWGWRNRLLPVELGGKRLLILGYGRSGRHLARMAQGFRMDIDVHDPFLTADPEPPVRRAADLAEGLRTADFVSIHIPRTDRPLLGAVELAAMKRGAILVNTARGGIVDETALVDALASGHLGGAGFDVFDDEPPGPDSPLLHAERMVLTPHVAGLTAEAGERMAVQSVQNVLDFLAGRIDPALVVNGVTQNG
jgi:D-3-phosphoglycerate dehydrogenase / 2-oxoglutarate reductase